MGHLLQLLDRDPEALAFLREASRRIESGAVVVQLASLEVELGHNAEARLTCERVEQLYPMLENEMRMWLHARKCDTAYACGDHAAAREWASKIDNPFYRRFAERLGAGQTDGRRVQLPVGFVRQHHMTCAPATLSAISRYWDMTAEHLQVAEEICYDGTPRHRAREWAAGQDFAVVEFRATWESVRAVLDRGLPFALVTRGTLSAHDQAVVGYDGGRGTLLIRCPSRPFAVELAAKSLFAEQAWCGPRATILLPTAELPRLSGLDLPDRGAYDHIHALEVALAEHRREDAGAIARQLARLDPRNRLNLWATLCLAHYDRDRGAELQCLEALLVAFPGTAALALWRLQVLADLAHPKIFARGIAEAGRRHPRDPAIQSRLAYELSREPRERERAWSVLRPLLRKGHWPTVALNILTRATMCGDDVRRVRALLSLAAHYNDMQEGLAMAYFKVVDSERRPDDGLRFLEARFTQYGRSSGDPATTLFEALVQAGRTPRAFTVLAKALSLRPHDADLHLFAAGAHAGHGDLDRAEEHLAEARGRTHRADWLRAAAAVAARREDSEGQLRLWHEVLGVQPAAFDAHTAIARLLAALGQPQAAVAHLRRLRHRFPQHHALNELSATAVDGGASPLS
jgi:Tfp pilus assembly protein PilF